MEIINILRHLLEYPFRGRNSESAFTDSHRMFAKNVYARCPSIGHY